MLRVTRFPRRTLTILGTALAAGTCDEGRSPEPDALTEAEVVALIQGLSAVSPDVTDPGDRIGAPATCPSGGQVAFSGNATADGTDSTRLVVRADITMVPQACRFPAGGVTFTIDGAPNIRQVGTTTLINSLEQMALDSVVFAYDVTGAVDWTTESPARSSTCQIDLDLTGNIDLPNLQAGDTLAVTTGSLAGTACGSSISISLEP